MVITLSAKSHAEALGAERQQVEDYAEKVAAGLRYITGKEIEPVIEAIGGKVRREKSVVVDPDLAPDAHPSLFVRTVGDFDIRLPPIGGPLRERFTIAHELGHYCLHFLTRSFDSQQLPFVAFRKGSERVEWEANWFAAAFLMPASEFRDVWQTCTGGKVDACSKHFGVSPSAARIRATTLELES